MKPDSLNFITIPNYSRPDHPLRVDTARRWIPQAGIYGYPVKVPNLNKDVKADSVIKYIRELPNTKGSNNFAVKNKKYYFTDKGKETAQTYYDAFLNAGFSPESSLGAIGSFIVETGIDKDAISHPVNTSNPNTDILNQYYGANQTTYEHFIDMLSEIENSGVTKDYGNNESDSIPLSVLINNISEINYAKALADFNRNKSNAQKRAFYSGDSLTVVNPMVDGKIVRDEYATDSTSLDDKAYRYANDYERPRRYSNTYPGKYQPYDAKTRANAAAVAAYELNIPVRRNEYIYNNLPTRSKKEYVTRKSLGLP